MRRPLLLLTMAVSLSLSTLVHAVATTWSSRFSAIFWMPCASKPVFQDWRPRLSARAASGGSMPTACRTSIADSRHASTRPFSWDGTTRTIVASLAFRCAWEGSLSLDETVRQFDRQGPADADASAAPASVPHDRWAQRSDISYQPDRLAPLSAAVAACTDSTFRFGVGALFDRLAMIRSVPGADVVRLTAPAEGFTASTLQRYGDTVKDLATPYAVDSRGRATVSTYAASALTPASGLISTVRDLGSSTWR